VLNSVKALIKLPEADYLYLRKQKTMKRRIRSIFILMTTCILGINVFQGYWLYTTYTLHKQQFSRTAMETLLVSLQKWQEADADRLLRNTGERPLTIYRELRDVKSGQQTRILYDKVDSANQELEKELRKKSCHGYYTVPQGAAGAYENGTGAGRYTSQADFQQADRELDQQQGV
jgi:hypothetical protein